MRISGVVVNSVNIPSMSYPADTSINTSTYISVISIRFVLFLEVEDKANFHMQAEKSTQVREILKLTGHLVRRKKATAFLYQHCISWYNVRNARVLIILKNQNFTFSFFFIHGNERHSLPPTLLQTLIHFTCHHATFYRHYKHF